MHILSWHRPDSTSRRPRRWPSRLAVLLVLLTTGPAVVPAAALPVTSLTGLAGSGSAPATSGQSVPTARSARTAQSARTVQSARAGQAGRTARSAQSVRVPRTPASGRLSAALEGAWPGRPAPSKGVWPLRPRPAVVAGFDPPATRWGSGHRGVDLAATPFAAVHSALPGTVTFAGRIAGRGVVVVSHGGTRTTYEPVAAGVAVGDRVGAGAVIGRLELFGSHCFPRWCLHWGLIEGRDHYLDPLTLVGAAPVRLLPLGGSALLPGDG